jgi:hypothetical protein
MSDFSSAGGLEIDATLRIVSSTFELGGFPDTWRAGFMIEAYDQNGRHIILGISSTGVRIANDLNASNSPTASSNTVDFDTTSDFHTYRLAVNSAGVSLRIDAAASPVATLALGAPVAAPPYSISFGDNTTSAANESYLKSLQWGVPEPSSLALVGSGGVCGIFFVSRRLRGRRASRSICRS